MGQAKEEEKEEEEEEEEEETAGLYEFNRTACR
jgi:hypothetical protein